MNRAPILFAGGVAAPITIAVIAFEMLKFTPSIRCDRVSIDSESSSRMQCAQEKANRQTVSALTDAIQLIATLPADDPNSDRARQLVDQWSQEVLTIAEEDYQAGHLEKAIHHVGDLPANSPQFGTAQTRIAHWQSNWKKGESLRKQAIEQMEKGEWAQAFQLTYQLRQLDNRYWAQEKAGELIALIQTDREFRDWSLKNPVDPTLSARRAKAIDPLQAIQPAPKRLISATSKSPEVKPAPKLNEQSIERTIESQLTETKPAIQSAPMSVERNAEKTAPPEKSVQPANFVTEPSSETAIEPSALLELQEP